MIQYKNTNIRVVQREGVLYGEECGGAARWGGRDNDNPPQAGPRRGGAKRGPITSACPGGTGAPVSVCQGSAARDTFITGRAATPGDHSPATQPAGHPTTFTSCQIDRRITRHARY